MPNIVVASSKGGAGKTTVCMVIASEMSRQGLDLTIIDADPNQHLASWADAAGFKNVKNSTEKDIIDDIKEAEKKTPFVIIDLEGTANVTMTYAINKADFVIIPCQMSDFDGQEGMKVINFIQNQDELKGSETKYVMLRTKTTALAPTNIEKAIVKDFESEGCNVLKNRLLELSAYKTIISNKCTIHKLETTTKKQEYSKQNAIEIAHDLTYEILNLVKEKTINEQKKVMENA